MAHSARDTKESKVDNTKTDDKNKTSTTTGTPTAQDRNDRPGAQTTVARDDAKTTAENAKHETGDTVTGTGTDDANRQFQRSEQVQADENQRPHMAGTETKINNPIMPEHPGQPLDPRLQAAGQPQPEMRNEDRRSLPNRHIQTVRGADRPAAAPVTGRSPEEQRRADRELEMARDPHGVRATMRSEVTAERIRSRNVGNRGPDDLTGGIVTESRQSGALVTNEQRAGAMPESSRRIDEQARFDEEERTRQRAEDKRTEVDRFADQRLREPDDGPGR